MIKRILLIDDKDMSPKIAELKRNIRDVEFYQFNIGSPSLTQVLSNHKIDIEKVKAVFVEKYGTAKPHLICFDYELGPDDVTGLDVLVALKPLTTERTQFLFYSSKIKEILEKILKKYREGGMPETKARELLVALITSKIEDFVGRGNGLGDAIGRILARRRETLDDIFEDKMKDYQDFKTDYYDGLEIRDIEQLLNGKDGRAINFKRELVEQFVASLIRLQDEE